MNSIEFRRLATICSSDEWFINGQDLWDFGRHALTILQERDELLFVLKQIYPALSTNPDYRKIADEALSKYSGPTRNHRDDCGCSECKGGSYG